MLASLKHRNVVQLIGLCRNDGWSQVVKGGSGLYICIEFIHKGSLDKHISGTSAFLFSHICHGLLAAVQYNYT